MTTKYRYIIWDSFDGVFKGTSEEEIAHAFAECEDYAVYDTETGEYIWMQFPEDTGVVKLYKEPIKEIHNPFDQ